MPRAKSELTGRNPKTLSVRWGARMHIAYLRLGGSAWLRAQVQRELDKAGGDFSKLERYKNEAIR